MHRRSLRWLDQLEAEYSQPGPRHSNAVVVIDKEGNIAAITHTINSVIWGDTGIVVGGIPIPDSAGFQQARLATIKPGDRVPNEMVQTIVFPGDTPDHGDRRHRLVDGISETDQARRSRSPGRDSIWRRSKPPRRSVQLHAGPAGPVGDEPRTCHSGGGLRSSDFVKNLEAQGVKVTKIPQVRQRMDSRDRRRRHDRPGDRRETNGRDAWIVVFRRFGMTAVVRSESEPASHARFVARRLIRLLRRT